LGADFRERKASRLILVNNERRKLMANALDRLSTAFVAVGVLSQIFSLSSAAVSIGAITVMAGWILGAIILHLMAHRILGGMKA
jgi:small-conductance mechanosensitive channel